MDATTLLLNSWINVRRAFRPRYSTSQSCADEPHADVYPTAIQQKCVSSGFSLVTRTCFYLSTSHDVVLSIYLLVTADAIRKTNDSLACTAGSVEDPGSMRHFEFNEQPKSFSCHHVARKSGAVSPHIINVR